LGEKEEGRTYRFAGKKKAGPTQKMVETDWKPTYIRGKEKLGGKYVGGGHKKIEEMQRRMEDRIGESAPSVGGEKKMSWEA